MTDPKTKEPATNKKGNTPLGIIDSSGKQLTFNHLSKLIYFATLSNVVLQKNTCPYCGNVGADTLQIEKQLADYLDLNTVKCQCQHCKRQFSLGIIKSKSGDKVEFIRSYMDNLKVIDTVHSMNAETLNLHANTMSHAARAVSLIL